MAEGMLKKELSNKGIKDYLVSSAGISVIFSSGASEYAIEVMKSEGIDISSHKAKQITDKEINASYLILTMTVNHKDYIIKKYPKAADKVMTLKEYTNCMQYTGDLDISDPFGNDINEYSNSMNDIKSCIEKLIVKIENGEL